MQHSDKWAQNDRTFYHTFSFASIDLMNLIQSGSVVYDVKGMLEENLVDGKL